MAILTPEPAADSLLAKVKSSAGCAIDRNPHKWEQPSDHTPVIATLDPAA
jgi:endonuclease/exonuclease/phosphatase family metal-dependent hydrolase